MNLYVLDADNRPVPCGDLQAWSEWFENISNRLVGYTEVTTDCYVSTVFLGMNHRFMSNGPPILFETMIFGGPLDSETWRYVSWDDAEAGHAAAVRKAREHKLQTAR
jgi:hypothetical protein